MPFRSQAQRKWMYVNHPEMAKRWEKETPEGKLPERIKKREPHAIKKALQRGGKI